MKSYFLGDDSYWGGQSEFRKGPILCFMGNNYKKLVCFLVLLKNCVFEKIDFKDLNILGFEQIWSKTVLI